MEMVREGETDVKSVCISVNNSVVDVPVTYIGDLEQFTGMIRMYVYLAGSSVVFYIPCFVCHFLGV